MGAHFGDVKEMGQETTLDPSGIFTYLYGIDNLIWKGLSVEVFLEVPGPGVVELVLHATVFMFERLLGREWLVGGQLQ